MRGALAAIILGSGVALSGCADKGLRTLSSPGPGPDDFMVTPVKPLTQPKDYQVLPPPTPGGHNLVDTFPDKEAVDTLGGRGSALDATGVPASDGALVGYAGRNGVNSNIREELAQEDAGFRKRQGRMTRFRLFPVDRYSQAYRRFALNPFGVTNRARASGINTPTSPPE